LPKEKKPQRLLARQSENYSRKLKQTNNLEKEKKLHKKMTSERGMQFRTAINKQGKITIFYKSPGTENNKTFLEHFIRLGRC